MLVSFAVLCAALCSSGFECSEDFSVRDARGGSYGIDIWRNSTLSHRHGWIEDGRYRIPVDGNRHFIAAPKLGDFRLDLDYALVPFRRLDLTLGYAVYFRHDRVTGEGHRLEIFYDRFLRLHFALDGKDLLVREDGRLPKLDGLTLAMEVRGEHGFAETLGARVEFDLPAAAPAKGEVGFDLTTNESVKLLLSRYRLSSPENPPLSPVGKWRFELSRTQGFAVPPVYEVSVGRYASGETRIDCRLSGTILSAPKRFETGGCEWCSMQERLTDPYVKVVDGTGKERKFFLWNGLRQFADPHVGTPGKTVWPLERMFIVREFPADFQVAAGYGHAAETPWRFAANGPYEQVQAKDGRLLFEGRAVEPGKIALSVRSPAEKKILSRLPADLPEREHALKHAREQHYFTESELPVFTFETVWRAADYGDGEIGLKPAVESVFGDKTDIELVPANDDVTVGMGGGLRLRTCSYRLARNPGVGVWHLETEIAAGASSDGRTERTVFEVLSDEPGGKAPPLVSGLPEFVSMPNEIKYLESSAFDPWGELGGIGHYYSVDMRYPAVGERLRAWEADHVYDRKYFTWSSVRNTDDYDMTHECNRAYMRHADYFGGYPNGKDDQGRLDYAQTCFYHHFQLSVLVDYLKERGLRLKLITPERLEQCAKDHRGLRQDELKELFDTCWDDFKAYAKRRSDAYIQEFVDYLMSVNSKAARASYGPLNVYTARYKSPYALEYNSHPVEKDPRIRANGSFWLLEDYHYSCDYPLCRPAYFTAGYGLYHPEGRRLFPEIYYRGWVRCEDGAVYQAHPDKDAPLADTHQRRIVYQYVYGTGFMRDDGTFGFWRDDGFHARNPEREAMDEFVRAWGKAIRNRPVRPLKAPYAFVDSDAFRRHGDTYVPDGSYSLTVPGVHDVRSDVINTAEEAIGYTYEQCVSAGYATPVVARLAAADSVTADNCSFAILPPLVKGTPAEVIASVRRLHERGVNLMCFEEATGLEDLFDVSGRTDFARRETKWGRTVFMKRPPTMVGRSSFLARFSRGRENVSEAIERGTKASFDYLATDRANRAERGTMMATATAAGDVIVILSDDSPIYGDTAEYPATFRFTVSAPAIGDAEIEADAPFSVVKREKDSLTIRTRTDKDTALFFRFRQASPSAEPKVAQR